MLEDVLKRPICDKEVIDISRKIFTEYEHDELLASSGRLVFKSLDVSQYELLDVITDIKNVLDGIHPAEQYLALRALLLSLAINIERIKEIIRI